DYTIDLSFTNATVDMDFYPQHLPPPEGYFQGVFETNALPTNFQGPDEPRLPVPNSNTCTRLVLVPQTGYQFTGWSGSVTATANPLVIFMDDNKNIQANLTPVSLKDFTATQMADGYESPGLLVVHAQLSYPVDRSFLSLRWRPTLPAGWKLVDASCPYQYVIQNGVIENGEVVWTGGPLNNNPVAFNFMVEVPVGETGLREIPGEITYTISGTPDPISGSLYPNVLRVSNRESASVHLSIPITPRMEEAPLNLAEALGTMTLPYTRVSSYSLTVTLSPPEVVAAGAKWKLSVDDEWRESGVVYTNLPVGLHAIEFKPVPGWVIPSYDRLHTISTAGSASMGVSYQRAGEPTLSVSAENGFINTEFNRLPLEDRPLFISFSSAQGRWITNFFSTWQLLHKTNFWGEFMAVSLTGYQFGGWSGSLTGSRNPSWIQFDGDVDITAQFKPVSLTAFTATQMADFYYAPGILVVYAQLSYPIDRELASLSWRPVLPTNWRLIDVTGLYSDAPILDNDAIVVAGTPVDLNPVFFNMMIQVPAGETGMKEILGEITYTLHGTGEPSTGFLTPNPLQINGQVAPEFQLSVSLDSSLPVLEVRGQPGMSLVLQKTLDLVQPYYWQTLSVLTLTNSFQSYTDTQSITNQPGRLYRAVLYVKPGN
ncbi:MAG TPA: hypothetical protein P5055_17665, partial [Candidatus Paceibacterota bacterium]|nr:hypothetical protein [Candidatus Paceibacterota bacterium]